MLPELGLEWHDKGTAAAKEAGLRAMAARTLSGELTPRELTAWAHRVLGHQHEGERLSELDDTYDVAPYATMSDEEVDELVMAEVRRITS
ncbi:hypothetical protein ACIA8G_37475 [Lentzea sp. NPDC051213]|uniref:hypothetical protein n=1 Tax=Lentzea sp. NPDC051213 TaxID=3364126 RepID=UPI00378999C5